MALFLTSAVVAALVAAVVSVFTSERKISAENVIQERKIWREKIRDLSSKVYKALTSKDASERDDQLKELKAEISLLVNPHDPMDKEILDLIIAPTKVERSDEFVVRVALLLKHDWERAKREASLWRRLSEQEPQRVSFEHFRSGDGHNYSLRRVIGPRALRRTMADVSNTIRKVIHRGRSP